MSKSTLKKDYFWNTIGVLFQNATTVLLLIAITRINGIDSSGLFSYAAAVAIVLFAFGLWGGRLYQVSDSKREFDHRSYIVARIILAIVMTITGFIFSLVNGYDINKTTIIVILVLCKGIESIADAVYGVLQVNNGLSYAGKSLLYKAIVSMLLFVAIDIETGSIVLGSLAILLVNLLFIVAYDIRIAMKYENIRIGLGRISLHIRQAVTILKRTSPIFAVTFLTAFSINIPRYFIDKYDNSQIGYFGIIAVPITLIALVMSFILQPNIVQITKMYSRRQYAKLGAVVAKIMQVTFGFGVLVAAGVYILGVPVLNTIFGIDFSHHKLELMIMVAGGIANAFVAIYINLLTIMRRFKSLFYTLLCSNVLLVGLSGFFVHAYGMLAGVSLFALVNIVQVIILANVYIALLNKEKSQS